jgi:hypothetical protein
MTKNDTILNCNSNSPPPLPSVLSTTSDGFQNAHIFTSDNESKATRNDRSIPANTNINNTGNNGPACLSTDSSDAPRNRKINTEKSSTDHSGFCASSSDQKQFRTHNDKNMSMAPTLLSVLFCGWFMTATVTVPVHVGQMMMMIM